MDDMSELPKGPSDGSFRSMPADGAHVLGTVLTVADEQHAVNGTPKGIHRAEESSRSVPVSVCAALAIVRPLWDRSAAGWFVYASDGRLLYANAAVEQIIGSKVTIGSSALVPPVVPESRLAYQRVMKRLRSEPAGCATAITLPVPVGDECRLVSASLLAVPDTGGFGHAVIGMLQDVTTKAEPGRDAALERLSHLERVLARIASDLAGVVPSYEERLPIVDGLSPRQREILQRLVAGERPAAIARQLHLSVHTVRNHTKAIFRVFGVHSQSELLVRIRNHVRNDV